jgi:hypothetical protein
VQSRAVEMTECRQIRPGDSNVVGKCLRDFERFDRSLKAQQDTDGLQSGNLSPPNQNAALCTTARSC